MTYPVISDWAASVTSVSSLNHTLVYPSTITDGQLLIALFALDCGNQPTLVSGFSTWTQVFADTARGYQPTTYCYYKTASASQAGTFENFTSNKSEAMAGVMLALDLADLTIDYFGTGLSPDPPYTAPTVTMGALQDHLVLTGLALNLSSPADVIGFPTSYTDVTGDIDGTDVQICVQSRNVRATSETPSGSYTGGSDWNVVNLAGADPAAEADRDYFAFTIAIEPTLTTGRRSSLLMLGAG